MLGRPSAARNPLSTADPTGQRHSPTTAPSRALARSVLVRNVVFLTLESAVFFFGLALIDISSVIPSLFGHLTRLPLLIGLVGSAQAAFWLIPQIFVARVVAARQRKLPTLLVATSLSRLSWVVLLAALSFPTIAGPGLTLVAAYVSISGFWFLDGVAALAWFDLIARAVPATLRGRVFGLLSLAGGLFGVAGGLVVEQVVGQPGFPYPSDYRLLLIIALAAFAFGTLLLSRVVEAPGEPVPPPEPLGRYIRRLPSLLHERPSFRRLVGIQLLVGSASLAVPFYAPFGVLALGLPEASVGSFVLGLTVGAMVGGVAWGFLGDHGHKHTAVQLLAATTLVAPCVPLLLALAVPSVSTTVLGALLVVALFFVGCNRSGWVAYTNCVMEIAAPAERPVLIGLMNTLGGVLAIAPPIGGLLAGSLGYEATFAAAAIPAAAGLILSLGLRFDEKR